MDKIDKLKKLLELSQNDTITPKEVEQFLTMVLGFIKKSKDEFESLSAENLKTISDCVAYLEGKFTNTLDDKINVATGQMEANVSELKALIAKVKTIKPVDGIDGVNPDPEDVVPLVLAKLPKVKPFTVKRDEVVREINTGKKGDTKIELEQIEGMDKLEKGVLDRAVSILDSRTKFLINKNVKHDATMTGSGTDADPLSVVGGGGGTSDHALLTHLDYASSGHTGFEPAKGADDNYVTDAQLVVIGNTSGTNTGDQVVPDNLTDFTSQTAWRVFYSNTDGDVTELALGADGTFLKSNGATSAPSFAVPSGSGGGITRTVTTSSGAFTAGATADTDYVYLIAGAHAVALPTAVGNTNRYTFKNNHSAAITITPDGAETVEGGATLSLNPLASVDLISNNSVWFVI